MCWQKLRHRITSNSARTPAPSWKLCDGATFALEHVLAKVAPSHNFQLGAGVRAVQEAFAGQFAEAAKV
jgi:hypothetical protein